MKNEETFTLQTTSATNFFHSSFFILHSAFASGCGTNQFDFRFTAGDKNGRFVT
jgi:hypothetical protein